MMRVIRSILLCRDTGTCRHGAQSGDVEQVHVHAHAHVKRACTRTFMARARAGTLEVHAQTHWYAMLECVRQVDELFFDGVAVMNSVQHHIGAGKSSAGQAYTRMFTHARRHART